MKNITYITLAVLGLFLNFNTQAQTQVTSNSNPWPISGAVNIGMSNYFLPYIKLNVKAEAVSYPMTYSYELAARFQSSGTSTLKTVDLLYYAGGNGSYFKVTNEVSGATKNVFEINNLGTTVIGNSSTTGGTYPSLQVHATSVFQDRVIIKGPSSTITTIPTGYKLYVDEGILTTKLKVAIPGTVNWSDFVFDKSYKLMPLEEVGQFIDKNKHLPDVPSAEEMVANGLDVATMDAKLLQKIEELTLYMIEMQKVNDLLIKRIETLEIKK